MKKLKVVFAGHDLKFANLIINYLKNTNKYEIKIDQWTGHNTHNESVSKECLDWANIIICEWGLGNAVWYSEHKRPHQKLIVRMHRQELETIYPKQFVIENIDSIIAISPYVYEEFYRVFKLPREKTKMIFNTLDASSLNKTKIQDAKYNIGIVGICPKMKRLDLAVDIFEELWKKDNNYKLFIKGKMPQEYSWLWKKEDEKEYYEQVFERIEQSAWKNNVIFDGFSADMSEFYQKVGFVVSTSDFESFHLAPSEGMASGAHPVILKWDGSDTIYPGKYLFNTIEECIKQIVEINNLESDMQLQTEAKKYAASLFDINLVGNEWEELIATL